MPDPSDVDGSGDEVARHMGVFELAALAYVARELRKGTEAHVVRRRLATMAAESAQAGRVAASRAVERAWRSGERAAMREVAAIERAAEASPARATPSPARPATGATLGAAQAPQATPLDMVRTGQPDRRALPAARRAVEQATEAMSRQMQTAAAHTVTRTVGQYEAVVRDVARAQLAGEANALQVQQRALNEWARKGLPAFTDKAGRTWSNQSYSEMLTRTVTKRAYQDAAHATLVAEGFDLVIVSSHPNPAPMCQPFELKVLSLSGATRGIVQVPSATTGELVTVEVTASMAEAEAAGYRHPNCRHVETAFVPDVTRPGGTEPDPAGYEATQQQRYQERKIREWKRRQAVAGSEDEQKYARGKVREWQGRVREHIDKHGLDRRYYREAPLGSS